MKLALICTEKLPSPAVKGGAIQTMIDGVAPFLAEKHDLTIFSITDPDLPDRELKNKVHYIRFPSETYSDNIAEELSHHYFDVIHVFNRPKHAVKYKKAAPASHFVLSLHNDMFGTNKISEELGRCAVRSVEKIMTVSDYIKKTIVSRFPEAEHKIQVVYSGVDLDRYTPVWTEEGMATRRRLRSKYGIENRQVILFVGRLSRTKGPDLLIEAMKQLVEDHPDAVLVIAGGKWFSDNGVNNYVRSLYELAEPLGDQVLFTKYVPSDQIPDLFLIADIFVCSSQWQEPLARVHYEAMAAGVPVITTNRGGNAEVMAHMYNGLVLDDFDQVDAFVKAINFLLSDADTAATLARNGRDFVKTGHQFYQVAGRMEKVYLSALQDSREPTEKSIQLECADPIVRTRILKINSDFKDASQS